MCIVYSTVVAYTQVEEETKMRGDFRYRGMKSSGLISFVQNGWEYPNKGRIGNGEEV